MSHPSQNFLLCLFTRVYFCPALSFLPVFGFGKREDGDGAWEQDWGLLYVPLDSVQATCVHSPSVQLHVSVVETP